MKDALNYVIRHLLSQIGVMMGAEEHEIMERGTARYHWFVQRFNQLCDDMHYLREQKELDRMPKVTKYFKFGIDSADPTIYHYQPEETHES